MPGCGTGGHVQGLQKSQEIVYKYVKSDQINTKREYTTNDEWVEYEEFIMGAHRRGLKIPAIQSELASKFDFNVSTRQIKHRLKVWKLDISDSGSGQHRKTLKLRVRSHNRRVVGRRVSASAAPTSRKSPATSLLGVPRQTIVCSETPTSSSKDFNGLQDLVDEELKLISDAPLTPNQMFLVSAIASYKKLKGRITPAQGRSDGGEPIVPMVVVADGSGGDLAVPEWEDSADWVAETGDSEDGEAEGDEVEHADGDWGEDRDCGEEDAQLYQNAVEALDSVPIENDVYLIDSLTLQHRIISTVGLLSDVTSRISQREHAHGAGNLGPDKERVQEHFLKEAYDYYDKGDYYGVVHSIDLRCKSALSPLNVSQYSPVQIFECCQFLMNVARICCVEGVIHKISQVGIRCLFLLVRAAEQSLLLCDLPMVADFIAPVCDSNGLELGTEANELCFLLLLRLERIPPAGSSITVTRKYMVLLGYLVQFYSRLATAGHFPSSEVARMASHAVHHWYKLITHIAMDEEGYTVGLDDLWGLYWAGDMISDFAKQPQSLRMHSTCALKLWERFNSPLNMRRLAGPVVDPSQIAAGMFSLAVVCRFAGHPKQAIATFQNFFSLLSQTPPASLSNIRRRAELELCGAMVDRGAVLYVQPVLHRHKCPSCLVGNSCDNPRRIKSLYRAYFQRKSTINFSNGRRKGVVAPQRGTEISGRIEELIREGPLKPTHGSTDECGPEAAMAIPIPNSTTLNSVRSASAGWFQVHPPENITVRNGNRRLSIASIDMEDVTFQMFLEDIRNMEDPFSCFTTH
ncbi:hypothetical protein ABW19_dt0203195 [Dactylella cylindrospora]|nr:hypothetical protein ABW19_dt0203195 [Dactylella cylindrospora]